MRRGIQALRDAREVCAGLGDVRDARRMRRGGGKPFRARRGYLFACRERLSARRGSNLLSRGTRGVQPVPFDTLYGIRKCPLEEVAHTTVSRTSPKARASFINTDTNEEKLNEGRQNAACHRE